MVNPDHIPKLPNPPLQEVIFEAKWRLSSDSRAQREFDPEYETALGVLKKKLQIKFPTYERLLHASKIPNYQVGHRFWQQDKEYPLIQYGPGILAVNETDKNYQWKTNYYPTIRFALKQLIDSYEKKPLFVEANLRYIDSVVIDETDTSLLDFLKQNLQTTVKKDFKVPGDLLDINYSEAYALKDKSLLQLDISSGIRKPTQERVIVWQNTIAITQEMDLSQILKWLTNAHKTTSDLFKQMVSPRFYKTFTNEY